MDITLLYSSWFIILCAVLAGLCTFVLYLLAPKPNYSRNTLILLSSLRFITTFLIALLGLGPTFSYFSNKEIKPTVVIAQDFSKSMTNGKDSAQLAQSYNQLIQQIETELAQYYEVVSLGFGNEVSDTITHYGANQTNIGKLLDHVYNGMALTHPAGLVMLSDGAYNQGVNPVYFNYNQSFPIHTIGVGDTTQVADIKVDRVLHNELVYVGNSFMVKTAISAEGLKNEKAEIAIFHRGKKIQSRKIKVDSPVFSTDLDFEISADSQGVQLYTVKILGASRDENTANNQANFMVDVVESREKVLLLANGIHPDLAAIKAAIENEDKEVETVYVKNGIPKLDAYNVVIAHGFGSQRYLNAWKELWNSTIPLWVIAPSYANTGAFNSLQNEVRLTVEGRGGIEEAKPTLNQQFALFNVDSSLVKFLGKAPALSVNQAAVEANQTAKVLAYQKRGRLELPYPLWIFTERGNGNVPTSMLMADGLWKWRLYDYRFNESHENFDALIRKTVQLTSAKKDKSRFRLKIEKRYDANQKVAVHAEFYNKALEPVTDASITLQVTNENNQSFTRDFAYFTNDYQVDLGMLNPGVYSVKAQVNYKGESFTKKGQFAVISENIEIANKQANWEVLQKISSQTNGSFYTLVNANEVIDTFMGENKKPYLLQSTEKNSLLMNNIYWLVALLVLLAAEWGIRKYAQH